MLTTIKKFFVYTVIVATLVMVGGFSAAPASAAMAGDLVKKASSNTVYYLGSDMKLHTFPSEWVYFTHYMDFSKVKTIPDAELTSYLPLGSNVVVRGGTYLLKIAVDPKTYFPDNKGMLHWVQSESVAKALWGNEWYKMVREVPDQLFVNYSVGADITSATFQPGMLLKVGSQYYYVDTNSVVRPIADMAAFNANRFQEKFAVSASTVSGYTMGSSITGYEAGIATVAGPEVSSPSTPGSTSGTLSAMLDSMTPPSQVIVQNAQRVIFTAVNLTAGSADATVDSLTVERMGVAQDNNISEVILLDENGKQIGNEKSIGSNHKAIFNDDIIVSANSTKKLYLAANMAATLNSGEIVKLGLVDLVLKGGGTLSNTALPIVGNGMTMNTSIAIGTVTVTQSGQDTGAVTKRVGDADIIMNSVRLAINATEDVNVESIRFYQGGTAADADTKDLVLKMDGSVVAGPSQVANKEVIFKFATPVKILKGTNKEFVLEGDIVSGSSRTISWDFEKKTDVQAKGLTYGFYINPSYPNTVNPYLNDTDITIGNGVLTVSKGVVTSTNVGEGNTQEELGVFFMQAEGEDIQLTRLAISTTVTGTGNSADITNITVYDANGNVVAGPTDPGTTGEFTATSTDTFIVPVGKNKYTVKGNLNTDFAAEDTIRLSINTPATDITAKGVVTNNSITPSPASNITLDTVTVKVPSLDVSTSASPAAQTVIAGVNGFTFAHFVLSAQNSGEDIRVNTFAVRHGASASNIHSFISNITLYDGATALNTPKAGESGTTAATATSTISLLNPLVVAKGTSKTIVLKGDISGSAAGSTTHAFGLVSSSAVTATGAKTGNSVTPSVTNSDGQTMTIATGGTLNMFNAGNNPTEGHLVANSTGNTIQLVDYEAKNEAIEIQKIGLTISTSNGSNAQNVINTIYVYDGATLKGSVPVSGSKATVTLDNLIIPSNSSKTLTYKVDLNEVGPNKPSTAGIAFTIAPESTGNIIAKGVASGSTSLTKTGTPTSNRMNVEKTIPVVTKGNVPGTLANGAQVALGRFSVAANAKGDVLFGGFSIQLTTTTATVTNIKVFEDPDGSAIDLTADGSRAITETITAASGNPLNGGVYSYDIMFEANDIAPTTGQNERRTIGAGSSKVYEVRGDITGVTTGSSITVVLRGDAGYASTVPDTFTNVRNGTNNNFIWSDNNFGLNSSTATKTLEWFNGYKVYPTTTLQTLSK